MLGWLFKKEEDKKKQKISFTLSVKYNKCDELEGKLLKEATEKKDSGNIDEAIDLLHKAYKEISKSNIIYPVDTFLRLPLYLQQANKPDEAWKEFDNLLKNGYHNQMSITFLIKSDESKIYDKMRLFLQREKRMDEAVAYGLLSYFSTVLWSYFEIKKDEEELKNLKYKDFHFSSNREERFEKRKEDKRKYLEQKKENFKNFTSKERYEDTINQLLKKAKKIDKLDDICLLMENQFKNIPDINVEEFKGQVKKTLQDRNS
jgi:hypothetical protein